MKKEFGKKKSFAATDANPILATNTCDITLTPEGLAYLGVLPHQPIGTKPPSPRPAMKTARLIKRAM